MGKRVNPVAYDQTGGSVASICLALKTILARSGEEAGAMLEKGGFHGLLLDMPREFQALVDALPEGVSTGEIERKIGDELGTLSEGWLYRNRGILESISLSSERSPKPVCIGELELERHMLEGRMTTSLLEFRGMAGHLDASSWRELIGRIVDGSKRSVERQTARALSLIGEGHWLWVSDIHARQAAPALRREGHSCQIVLLGRPYLGTPLEALQAELAEGNPPDDRVLYLVQRHLEFLRDHVMVASNLDEAYDGWLASGEWARLYHLGDPA
jgi:hypothetical protein